jgi:TctA family transporter
MQTAGSLSPLYERPIALGFLIVAALMFLWPIWRERRARRPAS